MCLIILESGDHLGHVIKKNPLNGMIKTIIRNCELSGYYYKNDPKKYVIYGKDYSGISFETEGKDEDVYLNTLSYCSTAFVPIAISELFDNPLKKIDQHDIQFDNSLIICSLNLNDRKKLKLKKFIEYFKNISLEIDEEEQYIFKSKNTTLHYFLNVIVLIMTLMAYLTNEKMDFSYASYEKATNCMVKCDAPYYIRYFFSSRIFSKNDFNKLKNLLEKHSSDKFKMFYGNTLEQRRNLLENMFKFDIPIVDIGCGEGNYIQQFSKRLNDNIYIGYDIDENELVKAREKLERHEIKNAIVVNNLELLFENVNKYQEVDILISEVIEHMELIDVIPFILKILKNISFRNLYITTPNHDFNVNYIMESEFRHHDHKWEIGKNKFNEMIFECIDKIKLELKIDCDCVFFDIGDCVNDVPCTLGCMIKKI